MLRATTSFNNNNRLDICEPIIMAQLQHPHSMESTLLTSAEKQDEHYPFRLFCCFPQRGP